MVLSTSDLQDIERPVHILEALAEVPTSVVVQGQVGIAVSSLRTVRTQQSFLQDYTLCLQFNGLEEISKLELNASQLRNAGCYILVHWPRDRKH